MSCDFKELLNFQKATERSQCGALRLWDLGHLWKAFGRRFVVEKYRHLSLCQIAKPWLAGNLDTLGPNSSKVAIEGVKKNLKKKWGNLSKLLVFPFCQMSRFIRFNKIQSWCNTFRSLKVFACSICGFISWSKLNWRQMLNIYLTLLSIKLDPWPCVLEQVWLILPMLSFFSYIQKDFIITTALI